MFSSQKPSAFSAPELSGFSAVPSVASASAFEGVEGTAQNGEKIVRVLCNTRTSGTGVPPKTALKILRKPYGYRL